MRNKKLKPKKYMLGALALGILGAMAADKLMGKKKSSSKMVSPTSVAQTVAKAANPTASLFSDATQAAAGVKKGGYITSKGNKLARSKPTKIC